MTTQTPSRPCIQSANTLLEVSLLAEVLKIFSDDKQLGEMQPKIEEAFKRGKDFWQHKMMPSVYGEEAAKHYFSKAAEPLNLG